MNWKQKLLTFAVLVVFFMSVRNAPWILIHTGINKFDPRHVTTIYAPFRPDDQLNKISSRTSGPGSHDYDFYYNRLGSDECHLNTVQLYCTWALIAIIYLGLFVILKEPRDTAFKAIADLLGYWVVAAGCFIRYSVATVLALCLAAVTLLVLLSFTSPLWGTGLNKYLLMVLWLILSLASFIGIYIASFCVPRPSRWFCALFLLLLVTAYFYWQFIDEKPNPNDPLSQPASTLVPVIGGSLVAVMIHWRLRRLKEDPKQRTPSQQPTS
jgi:hypothetical protein